MGSKIGFYAPSDTVQLIDMNSNIPSDSVDEDDRWYLRWRPYIRCSFPNSRLLLVSAVFFFLSAIFFVIGCISMIWTSQQGVLDAGKEKPIVFRDRNIEDHFNSLRTTSRNSSCLSLTSAAEVNSLKHDLNVKDIILHRTEGELLNLWCSISDKNLSAKIDNVSINWSFENETLQEADGKDVSILPYRFLPSSFISFLIISTTSAKNSGDYYCSLNSPYEQCRQKITVNIVPKTVTTSASKVTLQKSNIPQFAITDGDILIFNEDFNSLNISRSGNTTGVWRCENGYTNFEIVTSTHNTSYTRDGILYLKPVFTKDIHGEEFLHNGTLLLGEEPFEDICKDYRDRNRNSNENVCWKNGHPEDIVNPVMVPVLRSVFGFVYGKLEMRAKMPTGDWITPIISLVPEFSTYGKSNSTESGLIHMVKTNGNKRLFDSTGRINKGIQSNCPALQYGAKHFDAVLSNCLEINEGFASDFHLYQLEWTPDWISLSIDGIKLVEAPNPKKTMFERGLNEKLITITNPWKFPLASNEKMAPFDHFFALRIGLSIGGTENTFSDDNQGAYEKPWKNSDPKAASSFWKNRNLWEPSWKGEETALQIDYIKVWKISSTMYSYDTLYR